MVGGCYNGGERSDALLVVLGGGRGVDGAGRQRIWAGEMGFRQCGGRAKTMRK